MNPLKQGLKPMVSSVLRVVSFVFIHESIKTRVETIPLSLPSMAQKVSLSMNPLKQGLKLESVKFH